MTTIRQIITDAFREGGVIEVGSTPEAEDFDEGLRRLQGLISSLFGKELGDRLTDFNFGTYGLTESTAKIADLSSYMINKYVPSNSRVIFNNNTAYTLYLDPMPQDGARLAVVDSAGTFATRNIILNGNGRKIDSTTTATLATNGLVQEWFYRADLGAWVSVTALTANSTSPFPSEYDEFLSTLLAMRLNPRYGNETAPETVAALERMTSSFKARYTQKLDQPLETALLRMTNSPMIRLGDINSNRFNTGAP